MTSNKTPILKIEIVLLYTKINSIVIETFKIRSTYNWLTIMGSVCSAESVKLIIFDDRC